MKVDPVCLRDFLPYARSHARLSLFLRTVFDLFIFVLAVFVTVLYRSGGMNEENLPSPDALLAEAEQERSPNILSSYWAVMHTLRNKGFSYREIAAWLSGRGVQVDHNEVYRAYTRELSDYQAADEEKLSDDEARREAGL